MDGTGGAAVAESIPASRHARAICWMGWAGGVNTTIMMRLTQENNR